MRNLTCLYFGSLYHNVVGVLSHVGHIDEEPEVLVENLGGEGYRFLCFYGSVSKNLHSKLIIVGDVAYTGILYVILNLVNRGEYRVNENKTDRSAKISADCCEVVLLIYVRGNVTTTFIEGDLHIEACVLANGADVMLGVVNYQVSIGGDVTCGNVTGAGNVDNYGLGLATFKLSN